MNTLAVGRSQQSAIGGAIGLPPVPWPAGAHFSPSRVEVHDAESPHSCAWGRRADSLRRHRRHRAGDGGGQAHALSGPASVVDERTLQIGDGTAHLWGLEPLERTNDARQTLHALVDGKRVWCMPITAGGQAPMRCLPQALPISIPQVKANSQAFRLHSPCRRGCAEDTGLAISTASPRWW